MGKKSLLWMAALALAIIPVASAKSYDIVLLKPSIVANSQLPAGDYTLRVVGANVVFTRYYPSLYMWAMPVNYGATVTIPVKLEEVQKKFAQTAVVTTDSGGVDQVQTIDLRGTRTELKFAE